MLKALELVGFKSFAEKTRFEFHPGITVVVGPNGSGKSNLVDAIKWVLGEQSPKSMRGREMADVIFNGSAARRALHFAEVTLTLDNAKRLLAVDTPEVHVTRRVYRGGDGEYLINHQPSRLRDIRELFAGTGIATEAYSVIEQGKVDILLQSSPRERRLIFEEAAGISRFKAKKLEATRRLERVDQNLLRLSDIVEEVENRLKSVRNQAAKARRYREYTARLQELRTQVGLFDWRRLSRALDELAAEVQRRRDAADLERAQAEAVEADALAREMDVAGLDQSIRDAERDVTGNRERIATVEAAIEHERTRHREWEQEATRHRRQLGTINARAGDLQQQLTEAENEAAAAKDEFNSLGRLLAEAEQALTELTGTLDALRGQIESRRLALVDQMRQSATLAAEIAADESRQSSLEGALARTTRLLVDLQSQHRQLTEEAASLDAAGEVLANQGAQIAQQFSAADTDRADAKRRLAEKQTEVTRVTSECTGARQRAEVLQELQHKLEGLSAGAKQVLANARANPGGPLRCVLGLVADLMHVPVDIAQRIDVALGEATGYLVVRGAGRFLNSVEQRTYPLAGRAGFVLLDAEIPKGGVDLTGRPGVLGRADRFVQVDHELGPLVERLLGRTWLVETLAEARALAPTAAPDARFVTADGELVTACGGELVAGPRQSATGLITRRSELRALADRIALLEKQLVQHRQQASELEQSIAVQEERIAGLDDERRRAADALAQHHARRTAAERRLSELAKEISTIQTERDAADTQREETTTRLASARSREADGDAELTRLEQSIEAEGKDIDAFDRERASRTREAMEGKVAVAKAEQRLAHLDAQIHQFHQHRLERGRAVDETRDHLADCARRLEQSVRKILTAEAEVAELYLTKESLAADVTRRHEERDALRSQRADLASQAQAARTRIRRLEEDVHERELAAGQLRHERTSLADRLREDYAIEIVELEASSAHADAASPVSEVDEEISDLRRKIQAMGGVNLDALAELEELEARYTNLSTQHADLSSAKRSLEQIIDRINADSRRLFSETVDAVRGHFQQLFRKLFGGGQADIVLEEGGDALEAGIEIVGRPPGKEPRSISLLSGGEKTLTCVALLLAIFRSRPSPFCVLDEVDAALDEANIERFVAVLNEFLAWTQFIVVTHSKKTMTAAHTLYGVTMQESGVSKQVSVRFEDVSENGEISTAAIQRAAGAA